MFSRLRGRLEGLWRLLDAIGWSDEEDVGEPVRLNVREHEAALREALGEILPLLTKWLSELPADAPDRAEREAEHTQVRMFSEMVI